MFYILILCIFASTLSLNDYQERIIYYNEIDNVCANEQRENSDVVNVTMIINRRSINTTQRAGTVCMNWVIPYWKQVTPIEHWAVVFDEGNLHLKEETEYYYHFGIVSRIIQKTRVSNPFKYVEEYYTCEILGNGRQDHFGKVNFMVMCDKIEENLNLQ